MERARAQEARAVRDKERAEGALESLLAQMKREFGVKGLAEALKAAAETKEETERLGVLVDEELDKVERQFGKELGG